VRLVAELRSAGVDGDTLTGHAAVFGQTAKIRGGYERIAPTAFDDVLKRDDDVLALVDHDPGRLLGRRASGTLRLAVDDDGLVFEVDLPDTSYARDVRTLVARGDQRGASFGFLPGDDTLSHAPDGKQLRTHTRLDRLLDVSVVALPAYDSTDVALRHVTFARPDPYRADFDRALHRALVAKWRTRDS
jgi:HK97 family phage prohead protease